MRGTNEQQPSLLALVSIESLVPESHSLRRVKPLADRLLRELSPVFDGMYAADGRPSVPPEHLLKATLLMALYSVRSERLFCEQLAYNMLFRWFLDLDMTSKTFDASTFSKNRERLLAHEVADRFLRGVVELAREQSLLSSEHFTVDGTMIEAWGSTKSFRPKEEEGGDNNGFGDFRGKTRSNETHESKTDPEARLWRKGRGREAKLAYMGHALMENRHGLVVDFDVSEANGHAERDVAAQLVDRERERREKRQRKAKKKQKQAQRKRTKKGRRMTLAADKAYDTRDFVRACRERRVTPHVAQNQHARRRSSIDGRTTCRPGYRVSQRARMLVEKVFGWLKTVGGTRRSRFRGLERTRFAALMAVAAFNLLRIPQLLPAP